MCKSCRYQHGTMEQIIVAQNVAVVQSWFCSLEPLWWTIVVNGCCSELYVLLYRLIYTHASKCQSQNWSHIQADVGDTSIKEHDFYAVRRCGRVAQSFLPDFDPCMLMSAYQYLLRSWVDWEGRSATTWEPLWLESQRSTSELNHLL